jgi:transmembrane sensor
MDREDELRAALRTQYSEARASANWDEIRRRRTRAPRRNLIGYGVTALAAAAAALIVSYAVGALRPAPLALRDTGQRRLDAAVTDAVFSDGSRVRVEAGGSLYWTRNDGRYVEFRLERGLVHFEVTPGGPRRWSVDAGTAVVHVVGTGFDVERRGAYVRVLVRHGRVEVRSSSFAAGARTLGAGEAAVIGHEDAPDPPEVRSAEVQTAQDVEAAHFATEPPDRARAGAPRSGTSVARTSGAVEGPVASAEVVSAAARLREADRLRARGDVSGAIAILDEVAHDPLAGRDAALASFTRARLELDRLNRPQDAIAALDHCLVRGVDEPLREDVLARRVEALSRLGDSERAHEAAAFYLGRYPSGRWRAEVEAWTRTQ